MSIITVEGGYPEAPTQALRNAGVAHSIAPYETVAQTQGFKTFASKFAAYRAWVAHRNGRVIMIGGARHFVMIDRPRAFDAALKSAIAASTR